MTRASQLYLTDPNRGDSHAVLVGLRDLFSHNPEAAGCGDTGPKILNRPNSGSVPFSPTVGERCASSAQPRARTSAGTGPKIQNSLS